MIEEARRNAAVADAGATSRDDAVEKGTTMADEERRRRRIDRLTADDYLEGLTSRDIGEVRAMREDCREEEAHLSYARRLLQGRLDIARAEQARRRGESDTSLIDDLARILADAPSDRPRHVTSAPLYAPGEGDRRRDDVSLDDGSFAGIVDLDDEGLASYLERLAAEEKQVSQRRRVLLDHLDALQAELVRRLQAGDVDVDEIVSLSVQAASEGDQRRG